VLQETVEAHRQILEDIPNAGLLVVTSADRLQRGWIRSQRSGRIGEESYIARLLSPLSPNAGLVTILDGHAATLSWLGAVRSHEIIPLGVEHFGQSGNIPDLYQTYGLDADAIIDATARLCIRAQ
jgi:pyruvate dehydrogenase E1 component